MTLTGAFDRASGVGEVSGPRDIRWIGGYAYVWAGHDPAFAATARVLDWAVASVSSLL